MAQRMQSPIDLTQTRTFSGTVHTLVATAYANQLAWLQQRAEAWQCITWESQGIRLANGQRGAPCYALWTPRPSEDFEAPL